MQNWEQWIRLNASKIQHPENFEERFVREIIARIPEITPMDLVAQYHFQDLDGSNRYIDFCIKNANKGYFVFIELDGNWKKQKLAEMLERQNVMMSCSEGELLRFANSTWLGKSELVIQTIQQTLSKQHKKHLEMLRNSNFEEKLKLQQAQVDALMLHISNADKPANTTKIENKTVSYLRLGLVLLAGILGCVLVVYAILLKQTKTNDISLQNHTQIATSISDIREPEPREPVTLEAAMENAAYLTDTMATVIQASDAKNHIEQVGVVVCGYVAQIKDTSDRTYINIGNTYPHQEMTIVIDASDISKFSELLNIIGGKFICIDGPITMYRQTPQVLLSNLDQLVGTP